MRKSRFDEKFSVRRHNSRRVVSEGSIMFFTQLKLNEAVLHFIFTEYYNLASVVLCSAFIVFCVCVCLLLLLCLSLSLCYHLFGE